MDSGKHSVTKYLCLKATQQGSGGVKAVQGKSTWVDFSWKRSVMFNLQFSTETSQDGSDMVQVADTRGTRVDQVQAQLRQLVSQVPSSAALTLANPEHRTPGPWCLRDHAALNRSRAPGDQQEMLLPQVAPWPEVSLLASPPEQPRGGRSKASQAARRKAAQLLNKEGWEVQAASRPRVAPKNQRLICNPKDDTGWSSICFGSGL